MTAIIIVVVVALVFFVSICVITFMVWKHETEMRTDSLKAIERKLESLSSSLSDDGHVTNRETAEKLRGEISQFAQEQGTRHMFRNRSSDPFDWVRTEREEVVESGVAVEPKVIEETIETIQPIQFSCDDSEPIKEREDIYNEMDLEFTEIKNLVSEIKQARDEELQKLEELQTNESELTEDIEMGDESEDDEEIKEFEDLAEWANIEEIELPDFDESNDNFNEVTKVQLQYDIGRSGKKYTAEELETLIKE